MGQQNSTSFINNSETMKQLKIIDKKYDIYMNVNTNKMYVKNQLFLRNH